MLVELVAQPHCLYFLCTEAIKYVYTIILYINDPDAVFRPSPASDVYVRVLHRYPIFLLPNCVVYFCIVFIFLDVKQWGFCFPHTTVNIFLFNVCFFKCNKLLKEL